MTGCAAARVVSKKATHRGTMATKFATTLTDVGLSLAGGRAFARAATDKVYNVVWLEKDEGGPRIVVSYRRRLVAGEPSAGGLVPSQVHRWKKTDVQFRDQRALAFRTDLQLDEIAEIADNCRPGMVRKAK